MGLLPVHSEASNSLFIHAILLICIGSLQFTCTQTFRRGNETDRVALLAFKKLITNDPLGALHSWNDSLHFCEWQGITCGRRHQRITVLNLQGQRLLGSLSPSIGNLTFLRVINLRNNSFHGGIPQEVDRLFRLQELRLNNNTFKGQIHENLSYCFNLMVMDLSYNFFTGNIPTSFGSLDKLEHLYFSVNNLHGRIPQSFGNLSSLQQLHLYSNSLEGGIPHELGQLKRLTAFQISVNKLSGKIPPSIYNLSSMEIFFATDNRLYGSLPLEIGSSLPNLQQFGIGVNTFFGPIPNSLANASGLKILDLSNNSFSGQVPTNLGALRSLWKMNLEVNQLGSRTANDLSFITSLSNCTTLESISLSDNNFGGSLPNSVSNLSVQLTALRLAKNQISGSIPMGLGNLANLIVLAMAKNLLTGVIPSSLGKLHKLQALALGENMLSGQIPSFLCNNITQLSLLNLGINRLNGSIPPTLRKCHYLKYLFLEQNSLTGDLPKQFMGLSSLLALDLSHNSLTGPLPSEVGYLKNLWGLRLSKNKLSGEIPSTLGSCLSLTELYMNGNFFWGTIPQTFSSLKAIEYLDLSHNNFSGLIPKYFTSFTHLQQLNLSFNNLEGEIPGKGLFRNASTISVAGNSKLCGGIPPLKLPPCPVKEPKKNKRSLTFKVVVTATSAIIFSTLVAVALLLCWRRKPRRKQAAVTSFGKSNWKVTCQELLRATGGFSLTNLMGEGSCGTVYKAVFTLEQVETIVAVKVFKLQEQGASQSFMSECEALRNIRHRNLVKILTSCSSVDDEAKEFKALVFEFIPNGSLEKWLHPQAHRQISPRCLNLLQRMDIAIDVASALSYLHHDCQPTIVHCDLKPSNILLDNDMCACVSDFGLARLLSPLIQNQTMSSTLKGTIGYAATEYGLGGQVSTQGDVYSYGILLLEMFTGKGPTDNIFTDGLNLHTFAKMALPDKVLDTVDPILLSCEEIEHEEAVGNLENQTYKKDKLRNCLILIVKIGVACSLESARERMTMRDVVNGLHLIKDAYTGARIHGERSAIP